MQIVTYERLCIQIPGAQPTFILENVYKHTDAVSILKSQFYYLATGSNKESQLLSTLSQPDL